MSLEARIKGCRRLARVLCYIVILASTITMLGSVLGDYRLVNPFQIGITIRMNTAICMFLSALAVLLMNTKYVTPTRSIAIRLISCFICVIATVTLVEFIFAINLHIDELLVKDNFPNDIAMYPGRMVILTAFVFLLQSIAICMRNSKNTVLARYANVLIYIAFVMSMIGFYQYVFNYNEPYHVEKNKDFLEYMCNMSLITSSMFMLTLTSLLLIEPLQNCIYYLIDRSIVGYLTRILVLGSFIIFPIIAIILKIGQESRLYDTNFAYTLTNTVIILCVAMLTFHVVQYLREAISEKNHTLHQLRDSESLFRKFAENIDSVFWEATPTMNKYNYISPAYDKYFKKPRNEMLTQVDCILEHIVDEDKEKYKNEFLKKLKGNKDFVETDYRIIDNDGIIKHLHERAFKLKDNNQNVLSVIGIISDMTAIRFTEKYAHIQKRLNILLNSGMGIHDIANEFIRIICESQGWEIGEIWLRDDKDDLLKCVEIWYASGIKLSKFEKIGRNTALQKGEGLQGKAWQEGRPIWVSDIGSSELLLRSHEAKQAGICSAIAVPIMYQDKLYGVIDFGSKIHLQPDQALLHILITICQSLGMYLSNETKRHELSDLTHYDQVTHLYNKTSFVLLVDELLQKQPKASFAIVMLDIFRFKLVNEVLGIKVGDQLLQLVANRLKRLCVSDDIKLARIGGDVFTYIMPIESSDKVTQFVNTIFNMFKDPFILDKERIMLKINVGIAKYPEAGDDAIALLKNADSALYLSKVSGVNLSRHFNPKTDFSLIEEFDLAKQLDIALEKKEFIVHYQPIVDLKSEKVVGLEALIRWQHPQHGLLLPGKFLSIAEETMLIIKIGESVMNQVCKFINEHHINVPISINLSIKQFDTQYDLVGYIKTILSYYGLESNAIQFEITENLMAKDLDRVLDVVFDLKRHKFKIQLDDFGVGFSSFNYLQRFLPDKIKIDKSFIDGVCSSQRSATVVKSMISVGQQLSMNVVAEGVESKSQADLLKDLGCYEIQGYYIAKPMSAEQILAFLKKDDTKES